MVLNPDEQSQEPSDEEYVFEDKTCTYEIIMKTSYGCPDQCKSPADVLGENEVGFQTATEVCNNKKMAELQAHAGHSILGSQSVPALRRARRRTQHSLPWCTFACPGENSRLGLCSKRGHCAYDADVSSTGKAVCFCDSGFMGETCQRTDPTPGKGHTDIVIAEASAVPWVLSAILGLLLLGAWFHHRNEMGEPFCCCGGGGGNSMAGFEEV